MESGSKKLLQKGDASLGVILGLVLISLALPASFRLVQQNQDVRKSASTEYVNALSNKRTRGTDDCVALEYISPYCQDECGGDRSYKMWSWHNPGEDPKGWFGLPCGDACKGFGMPLFKYEQRNQCQEPIVGNECATKEEMQAVGLDQCVPYPGSDGPKPTTASSDEDQETPTSAPDRECQLGSWQTTGACGETPCDSNEVLYYRTWTWSDTKRLCGEEIERKCVEKSKCEDENGISPTSTPTSSSTPFKVSGSLEKNILTFFGQSGSEVILFKTPSNSKEYSEADANQQLCHKRETISNEGWVKVDVCGRGCYYYIIRKDGAFVEGGVYGLEEKSGLACAPSVGNFRAKYNVDYGINYVKPGDKITLEWQAQGCKELKAGVTPESKEVSSVWFGQKEQFAGSESIIIPENAPEFFQLTLTCSGGYPPRASRRDVDYISFSTEKTTQNYDFTPSCDYENIDEVRCGHGYGPHLGGMGCSGVPEGCTRGSYYPQEDPDYRSYVEKRDDFASWLAAGRYKEKESSRWKDKDGWTHGIGCSCGPYKVHGDPLCDLGQEAKTKSGYSAVCIESPLCSKLQLKDTHPATSALGDSISIRVWSSPVLNTWCSTGNVSGVTVTLINNNSGNKWSATTDSKGKVTLNPTDTYIYNPECFDPYDNECNGEHYTLISEKSGYLPSYDDIYIKPYSSGGSGSMQENTLKPTNTTKPTKTPQYTSGSASDCSRKSEGDANCDGVINVSDFSIWRKEKHDQGADETQANWKSDFNGDGLVKNDDFSIWLNNLD
jgi:hypothetical protein